MKVINERDIIAISNGRAILETELCKKMYHVYNTSPIIDKLQALIALAIEQICALGLADTGKAELRWINAIKQAGANLAIWEKYAGTKTMLTVKNLIKVLDHADEWTASDCGDLMRLFGGIIEDRTLQDLGLVGKDVEQYRREQRVGPGFGGDQRSRRGGGYEPNLPHIEAAHNAILRFKRAKGFSGFSNVTLNDQSTVKKIDSTFGLAEGCDISGTTADSIFFFRHVNAFIRGLPEMIGNDLMPIIQLLPMATMASQGHHTIIECGLTLTLNNIINYRICFYTTLMPPNMGNAQLQSLFSVAEKDMRNKHMLCYWNNGHLEGILYDTPLEINALKDACLANEAFRSQFVRLPLRPTKTQLFSLRSLSRLPQ
jgi:hypothetical protein